MAEKYHPGRQHKIEDRKERFEGLLEFVRARNGWITSVPGAPDVTIECLPDSRLPDDLRGLGYVVTAAGEGERICADGDACGHLLQGKAVRLRAAVTRCCQHSPTAINTRVDRAALTAPRDWMTVSAPQQKRSAK
jgi:hypothetical protein